MIQFGWVSDPDIWASLLTLTAMEIVLGIDNVVFVSISVLGLPPGQAAGARRVGLALALVFRILLLMTLAWLIGLTQPVFSPFGHAFSWWEIILLAGGLFLVW